MARSQGLQTKVEDMEHNVRTMSEEYQSFRGKSEDIENDVSHFLK